MKEQFRLSWFTYAAAVLLTVVYLMSPAQFPIVIHKASIVTLGGVVGYWLDRHLFPNARELVYNGDLWMVRRAIVVAACVVSMGIAL